jgi:RimJ/RimL family protein N-acetyltransferase
MKNFYDWRTPLPALSGNRTSILSATLKDGQGVLVREVVPRDAEKIAELLTRLSAQTFYLRFLRPPGDESLIWRTAVDFAKSRSPEYLSLVALSYEKGDAHAVALIQLVSSPKRSHVGELAIVVRDDYQRQGLGQALCRLLFPLATASGIYELEAIALAENQRILGMLRRLDVKFTSRVSSGERQISMKLSQTT